MLKTIKTLIWHQENCTCPSNKRPIRCQSSSVHRHVQSNILWCDAAVRLSVGRSTNSVRSFLDHLSYSGDILLFLELQNHFQPNLAYNSYGWREEKNCKIHGLCPPEGWGWNHKINAIFKKNLFFTPRYQTVKLLTDCYKHWALFPNHEIHDSMMRGSGAKVGSNDYKMKMHWFHMALNVLLCTWVFTQWIQYIVMMRKNASSRIVNFMAPGSGVLVSRGCDAHMII